MKTILATLACVCVLLSGCSRAEEPRRPTASDIQKQIAKVQNDPNIPANVKGMILGKLEGEKQAALQSEASKAH